VLRTCRLPKKLGGTATQGCNAWDTSSQHHRFTAPVIAEQFASLFHLHQMRLQVAIALCAVDPGAFGPTTNLAPCLFKVIPGTRKTISGVTGRWGTYVAKCAALSLTGNH